MIEFLDIMADLYWVFILITVLVLLALIGYNSVKKTDFVVKTEYRSNKEIENHDNNKSENDVYKTDVLDMPSSKPIDKL